MKAKFSLAIIAITALLTACGGNHEKVHAVDKVEEAQKLALEKAPKAEEVKFADHGQTPMGGVGGANPAPLPAPTAEATATATATDTKPAETVTPTTTDAPATAEATATTPTDTAQATADTAKPADEPAKTETAQTETPQTETKDTAEAPKAQ